MKRIAYEDYPDVLNAEQIAMLLGISRSGAYQLLNRADFPTLHIGKRKSIHRNQQKQHFDLSCVQLRSGYKCW